MNTQTDNSSEGLKLAVRRWVWDRIPERRVLDLYCGKDGKMWEGIWQEADSYLGCDKFRPHNHATTLKMSAEKAVRYLRLDDYTIYDVDCYDSPWVVTRQILRRRGPGTFGLCLTVGEDKGLKNGGNEIIRSSIGLKGIVFHKRNKGSPTPHPGLTLLHHYRELVYGLMLRSLAELPGIRLLEAVKGVAADVSQMHYFGLIVQREETPGGNLRAPYEDSRALLRLPAKSKQKRVAKVR